MSVTLGQLRSTVRCTLNVVALVCRPQARARKRRPRHPSCSHHHQLEHLQMLRWRHPLERPSRLRCVGRTRTRGHHARRLVCASTRPMRQRQGRRAVPEHGVAQRSAQCQARGQAGPRGRHPTCTAPPRRRQHTSGARLLPRCRSACRRGCAQAAAARRRARRHAGARRQADRVGRRPTQRRCQQR
eukprot:scaffold116444_cov31-Tisochrysis_lutea.AAC.1